MFTFFDKDRQHKDILKSPYSFSSLDTNQSFEEKDTLHTSVSKFSNWGLWLNLISLNAFTSNTIPFLFILERQQETVCGFFSRTASHTPFLYYPPSPVGILSALSSPTQSPIPPKRFFVAPHQSTLSLLLSFSHNTTHWLHFPAAGRFESF